MPVRTVCRPPRFPVLFSKPITNLRGMGIGSRVLRRDGLGSV
jgi:hypothetical protein